MVKRVLLKIKCCFQFIFEINPPQGQAEWLNKRNSAIAEYTVNMSNTNADIYAPSSFVLSNISNTAMAISMGGSNKINDVASQFGKDWLLIATLKMSRSKYFEDAEYRNVMIRTSKIHSTTTPFRLFLKFCEINSWPCMICYEGWSPVKIACTPG